MDGEIKRIRDILNFLLKEKSYETERLDIEIKKIEPLDSKSAYGAQIAKAIMALANHGSGILIIGFHKQKNLYIEDEVSEPILSTWEQTRLHDLLERHADPIPEVQLYSERGHPVAAVRSCGSTPIVCIRDSSNLRAGAVYIRRPGPKSQEPQNAREWRNLLRCCLLSDREEIATMIRTILIPPIVGIEKEATDKLFEEAIQRADQRFKILVKSHRGALPVTSFGRWTIACQFLPSPKKRSLRDVWSILEKSSGHETGWPIGVIMSRKELAPRPHKNSLEAWMFTSAWRLGIDYWRAEPTGFFYQTRVYPEDLTGESKGKVLEWMLPIWRTGEAILHALRMTANYGNNSKQIKFFVRYSDLDGRTLYSTHPGMIVGPSMDYTCHTSQWSNKVILPSNLPLESLPDVVEQLLDSFYEQFDLFKMPKRAYIREIHRMAKGI